MPKDEESRWKKDGTVALNDRCKEAKQFFCPVNVDESDEERVKT